MTISYNYDVSSVSILNFFKIAFRWKGSIYKNVKTSLAAWLISYFIISTVYRYILDDENKRFFNKIAGHIDKKLNNLPLQFLLGFFVSVVIDRWKQTFYNMGYIETAALTVTANLWGKDTESHLQRRGIVRFLVLHQILVFRDVSISVRRRFPNLESLVTAGFALQHEVDHLESLKFDYQRYWVPINWAISIVRKANDQKKFDTDSMMNAIVVEICKFRTSISQLCVYDWVPIPLQYLQVVATVVHVYFLLCLFSRQYLLLHDPESDPIDLYFPLITVFQFVFLFGWLQVAVDVLNPLGDGDDDFECNFLIDKNLATGLSIADRHHLQPKMEMDLFAFDGFKAMYTPESAALMDQGLFGSVSTVNLTGSENRVEMVEVVSSGVDLDKELSRKSNFLQNTFRGKRATLRSHQIRPIRLGSSLPVNLNLDPDRPCTSTFDSQTGETKV